MQKRIYRSICVTALVTILFFSLLVTLISYWESQDRMKREVREETSCIREAVELSGEEYLAALTQVQNRITLIDGDGTVMFDNYADPGSMGNHSGRTEVRLALETGAGEDVRMSDTLSRHTFYYAVRLSDGCVLRVASTTDTAAAAILGMLPWILLGLLAAAGVTALLSRFLTKRIVEPINQLDLERPTENAAYQELSPLLGKLEEQKRVITAQMKSLREKQEEFASITENMSEGFLVLDRDMEVLSYNTGALRLLGASPQKEDKRFNALDLNPSPAFREALESALSGHRAEAMLREEGWCRQVLASPVTREGRVSGVVVVILDVTEREERESLRREFTANVSHELKTPLTSISGFAEIILEGIAKAEDVPRFAGNIYREAQRLISLVNDIMELSRLDEGETPPWEELELLSIVRDTVSRLGPAAEKRGVQLLASGEEGRIRGVRSVVEEMAYNLCDNGVKYNRPGGKVVLTVENTPHGPKLTVADTGIGIPKADQSRVFERFYRVDKSHSREIGGTGLGLSIVKHGARLLGAQLSLESREGEGTRVEVAFPPAGEKA